MKKATFKYKYYGRGYERDFVYLVYEYRGREYTVYENLAKGNEPLSWQHRSAQAEIDRQIELENKPQKPFRYEDTAQYGIDLFMDFIETGEWKGDKS